MVEKPYDYEEHVAKELAEIKGGDYSRVITLMNYLYHNEEYEEGVKVLDLLDRPLTDEEYSYKIFGCFKYGDFEEGKAACLELIKKDNAMAQYYMGIYYEYSKGEQKSLTEAFSWYKKAADNGYAPAMAKAGNMFDKGEGVDQNKELAMEYYYKGAEQDDPDACYALAKHSLLENPKAISIGLARLHIAIAQRTRKSIFDGGYQGDRQKSLRSIVFSDEPVQAEYLFKVGFRLLPTDFERGFSLLKESAEKGSERAAYICGREYLKGKHVDQDIDKAMEYFQMYDTVRSLTMEASINMMEDSKYYDPIAALTKLELANDFYEDEFLQTEEKKVNGIKTCYDLNFVEMRKELFNRIKAVFEKMQKQEENE